MVSTYDTPRRRTLAGPVRLEGRGIHSGATCRVRFEPAPCGEGIALLNARTSARCPATIEFADALASERRTVLVNPDGVRFEQIEHMMAALAAAGVSDATIVMEEGIEPPFMGGGSREFLDEILKAGLRFYDAPWDPIVIDEPISFRDEGALLSAAPAEGLLLSAFVEFPGTVVGSSGHSHLLETGAFLNDISRARTFALARDVEMLRKAGLGRGGSLENTVVFDEKKFHNDDLHYPNEPARHKVIDLLGDLALLGSPLRGHVSAWRAGHRSHVRFAQHLHQEIIAKK